MTTKTSKKAQSIFSDTFATIDNYVNQGIKFDSLSSLTCISKHIVTKATIRDLEVLCKREFRHIDQDVKFINKFGDSSEHAYWESVYWIGRKCEVARRMWLTIQTAKKVIDEWGDIYTA